MANKKRARADSEIQQTKDWGVPNWKKRGGYPPKWDKLSNDKKKWEFLRRTKEYREDWKQAQSPTPPPTTKPISKFHVLRLFNEKALTAKYRLSHPISPQVSYKELPNGFGFLKQSLMGGDIVYPRFPKKREKGHKLTWDEELALCAEESTPRPLVPKDWYDLRVWVEFDLSYSLEDQMPIAMKNLVDAKAKAKVFMNSLQNPQGQYGTYDYAPKVVGKRKARGVNKKGKKEVNEIPCVALLRILDARNCGRNNVEIKHGLQDATGECINTSTVSKRYKVAKRYWKRL